MSARTLVESLLRGWLPQPPIGGEINLVSHSEGRSWNGRTMLRLGGASGIFWSALTLLASSGMFYVVGRTTILYDVIDLGLITSGVIFFAGIYLVFARINTTRTRMAVSLGIGGSVLRFAAYLPSQIIFIFGLENVLLSGGGRAVVPPALSVSAGLLVALSMLLFGTLISIRPFRTFSVAAGLLASAGGFLELAGQLNGSAVSALSTAASAIQSMPQYVSILWVLMMSVSFLYLSRTVGWRFCVAIIASLGSAELLSIAGVFWIPRLLGL